MGSPKKAAFETEDFADRLIELIKIAMKTGRRREMIAVAMMKRMSGNDVTTTHNFPEQVRVFFGSRTHNKKRGYIFAGQVLPFPLNVVASTGGAVAFAVLARKWAQKTGVFVSGVTPKRGDINSTIDRLLDDQAVRLLIAAEPTRTDVILGWLAYTPMPGSRCVHYVYTRERMRRRGIAAALVRKAFPRDTGKLVHTMRGPDCDSLLIRYPATIYLPVTEFLGE